MLFRSEFKTFKTYIEENGITDNLDILSTETGISVKNLNRFIEYTNMPNQNNINL